MMAATTASWLSANSYVNPQSLATSGGQKKLLESAAQSATFDSPSCISSLTTQTGPRQRKISTGRRIALRAEGKPYQTCSKCSKPWGEVLNSCLRNRILHGQRQ